jgi:hypothetical protein
MKRHIRLQHDVPAEPIDSITGLARFQRSMGVRGVHGNRYYRNSDPKSRFGSWPSYYQGNEAKEDDSDKRLWGLTDMYRNLKELELLKGLQGDLATIKQQNTQIIALLEACSTEGARPLPV